MLIFMCAIHGVGMVDLKFILRKIVLLGNIKHVPSINKNLVRGSLLFIDGFKTALDSNKLVVSKHVKFIGKCRDYGGLFRFSLSNFCNKSMNHICGSVNDDASTKAWYVEAMSISCHVLYE